VNGEMKTDIQYYHRRVEVVLVSTSFPIPLGVRFQKNGEGEVACALALLQDLVGQLGRRFLDVLVGDALYLQAPFVKQVERLGLVWAFTLKENQPELLHEAERCTQATPTGVHQEPGQEIRYWHLPDLDWPVAERRVQVVKTFRIEPQPRVTISKKDCQRTKGKTPVAQPSTNFYATNFRTRFDLTPVHSSVQSQSLANRYRSLSHPHHRLSPQAPCGPPNHRPGGADHDPLSGLHFVAGLLPPSSLQPCPPKM
jgi:hypothetical protein